MDESRFIKEAERQMADISDKIEEQDIEGILEIDFSAGDILHIFSPDGEYVINKQTPARELWVSSPVSGPWHFKFTSGPWVDSKNVDLISLLENELGKHINLNLN